MTIRARNAIIITPQSITLKVSVNYYHYSGVTTNIFSTQSVTIASIATRVAQGQSFLQS